MSKQTASTLTVANRAVSDAVDDWIDAGSPAPLQQAADPRVGMTRGEIQEWERLHRCPRCGFLEGDGCEHRRPVNAEPDTAYCEICDRDTQWKKLRCLGCAERKKQAYKDQLKEVRRKAQPPYYGLSPDDYHQLTVDADGHCMLCHREAKLCIDHDHRTGWVRGLLCGDCNRGLGLFRDNPDLLEDAAGYLRENQEFQ